MLPPVKAVSDWIVLSVCLQVVLENAPPSLLQGQLLCCRLLLRNTGPTALKALRMSSVHPDIHLAAPDPSVDDEPLALLSHGQSALSAMSCSLAVTP